MNEILPGILHWTAFRDTIGQQVSSYYVESAAALIDPMLPEGGLAVFDEHQAPQRILLTCRHHLRDSSHFVEAFGCSVHCHADGLHEFAGGPQVEAFRPGDVVAPGVEALEVGSISPDETALHISADGGALAFADGFIHTGGKLGFVPDSLIGDDPEQVKRGLLVSFERLAERDPAALLFAHGDPLVGDGGEALREFLRARRA